MDIPTQSIVDREETDKIKDAILVDNNAQTIYDHLDELEKEAAKYEKRWFWELLQNAKDAVEDDNTVQVSVELHANRLSFYHTGDPFDIKDVLHLIFHGSSKKKKKGKTGRFGTGFMTTHLLSRKAQITGQLADGRYFDFELNREPAKDTDEKSNLDLSYDAFNDSKRLEPYLEGVYTTRFTYDLKSDIVAKAGIEQLSLILPFVMAFNTKITSIEINNNGKISSVRRGSSQATEVANGRIITQEILSGTEVHSVVMITTPDSDMAVLLEKKGSSYSVVDLDDRYPKLFFDFPLFGTEKLGIPVVMNSNKFDLKAERDGIYLGDEKDKPTIAENKRIFSESLGSISELISFLVKQQMEGIYNVFKLAPASAHTWLDRNWVSSLYKQTVEQLLTTECRLSGDSISTLSELVVPYSETLPLQKFHTIVSKISRDNITPWEDTQEWIKVAEGYAQVEEESVSRYPFIFNESKLCTRVNNLHTLDALEKEVAKDVIEDSKGKPEYQASIEWLNDFLRLLSKNQLITYTDKFEIIPNQLDEFTRRDIGSLFIDQIDNEELKTIAQKFGWNIKEKLIKKGIFAHDEVFVSILREKVITDLLAKAERITDEELNEEIKRDALQSLFKWLLDNKREIQLREAFVIVDKAKEQEGTVYSKRRLYLSNADKLLAPAPSWDQQYSMYKEVVPRKFIMDASYSKVLSNTDLEYLHGLDLIHLSPLVHKTKPSKVELKLLVKDPEDYAKLLNERDEVYDFNLEFSDIVYLTRTDENILSRTAESSRTARALLWFLLTEVIEHDAKFDEITNVTIGNAVVPLSNCLWISRLRDTQWLPAPETEGEKRGGSERPSVANITELIKKDKELITVIRKQKAARFFNLLGISVADILRNTLSDENEKLEWDMAFSQLITRSDIEPGLAVEMLSDPELQKVYKDKIATKALIHRNQNIGKLFEQMFDNVFRSEEYAGKGFKIDRTGIGSDFEVSGEQDIIDENGNEVFFTIRGVLLELKATGKQYAEMTPRQVEEASKTKENYVLAVLPLEKCEGNINEETVKANTRFVIDIGLRVEKNYEGFVSYSEKLTEVIEEKNGVTLAIDSGKVRYQVNETVWVDENALDFERFVEWLITGNRWTLL